MNKSDRSKASLVASVTALQKTVEALRTSNETLRAQNERFGKLLGEKNEQYGRSIITIGLLTQELFARNAA